MLGKYNKLLTLVTRGAYLSVYFGKGFFAFSMDKFRDRFFQAYAKIQAAVRPVLLIWVVPGSNLGDMSAPDQFAGTSDDRYPEGR